MIPRPHLRTISATRGVRVDVTAPLRHLCPIVDEIDDGEVTVGWTCIDATLELHDLAAFIRSYADERISHEDLVTDLTYQLEAVEGIANATVQARFATGGMRVTVTGI